MMEDNFDWDDPELLIDTFFAEDEPSWLYVIQPDHSAHGGEDEY